MEKTSIIPLKDFISTPLLEKANLLSSYGTLLMEAQTGELKFFLYAMHDYLVQATARRENMEITDIKATKDLGILDVFLEKVSMEKL